MSEQHEHQSPAESRPAAERPWTILGRLSKAVREQNWFAVALELAIVVLGVVIGFQVTAWGQARTERALEQEYLHQLAEDLRESEERLEEASLLNRQGGEDLAKFIRAFSSDPEPPTDSLLIWGWQSRFTFFQSPVVGTSEALVSTGDIRLIRNDSLRLAVIEFLEDVRIGSNMRQSITDSYLRRYERFQRHFDMSRAAAIAHDSSELDSLAAADYLFVDGPASGVRPRPDPANMLGDLDLYDALRDLRDTRADLRMVYSIYLEATRKASRLVEEELNR